MLVPVVHACDEFGLVALEARFHVGVELSEELGVWIELRLEGGLVDLLGFGREQVFAGSKAFLHVVLQLLACFLP